MKHIASMIAGAALALAVWTAAKADPQALMGRAAAAELAEDWTSAADLMKQVMADPDFAKLDSSERHRAWLLQAGAAAQTGDNATALVAIRQACTFAEADGEDWYLRLVIATDTAELADSLTMVAERYPEILPQFYDPAILQLISTIRLLPDGKTRSFRIAKALFAAHWLPEKIGPAAADPLWLRLALDHLENNDVAAAEPVVAAITNPNVLVQIVVDKRFDGLVAANPARFDIAAAAERDLTRSKARIESHPDMIGPYDAAAVALMRLGRFNDALALLDKALAAAEKNKDAYTDIDRSLLWLRARRGEVLTQLGRSEEGLAQRQESAAMPENGTANVSEVLNLASKFAVTGRAQEALALLAKVPAIHMSAYGRMVYEKVRACADARLGDAAGQADAMAYLKAHAAEAPKMPLEAMNCAGDVDGLAAEIIAQLENPETRADMLLDLQDFQESKLVGESDKGDDRTWNKASARSDVQAVVEKVGRHRSFAIYFVRW